MVGQTTIKNSAAQLPQIVFLTHLDQKKIVLVSCVFLYLEKRKRGLCMKFFTTVRKRRRGARLEWTVRLIYKDQITGKRKELSKSASSRWEAKLLEGELRNEFMAGARQW